MSAQSLGFVMTIPTGSAEPLSVRYDDFVRRLFKADTFNEMVHHAKGGICEEAGEISDVLKRHVTYGKPLNREQLVEELGDIRFYIQAVQNIFDITEQEILQHNANKLNKRYADLTYSGEAAIARADKGGTEPAQESKD